MADVVNKTPSDFVVLSGDDNMCLDLIEKGGHGVISVAANLFPRQMSQMVSFALNGKMDEARAMEKTLSTFFKACFLETNPIPIKTALARYKYCIESFRLPLCTLESDEHRAQLYSVLDELSKNPSFDNYWARS